MKKRRIKFNIGVSCKTTAEQMTDAVEVLRASTRTKKTGFYVGRFHGCI